MACCDECEEAAKLGKPGPLASLFRSSPDRPPLPVAAGTEEDEGAKLAYVLFGGTFALGLLAGLAVSSLVRRM